MKRLFILIGFTLAVVFCSVAQNFNLALGVNGDYASRNDHFGIGANVSATIKKSLRFTQSFDYYFSKNGMTAWELNGNFNYLFHITDQFKIYPLAGYTFTGRSKEHKIHKAGINLGGGMEFDFNNRVSIYAETKAQLVNDYSQSTTSVGLRYIIHK